VSAGEKLQVVKTADRIRDEFLVTLRELDRRAQRAMDVRGLIRDNRRVVIAAGAGLAAVVVVIIGTSVALSRSRQSRLPERRIDGLRRAWENPERIARPPRGLPRPVAVLLTLLKVAAAVAGTEVVRRRVQRRSVQRALPAGR
jgi:hypothetical protein